MNITTLISKYIPFDTSGKISHALLSPPILPFFLNSIQLKVNCMPRHFKKNFKIALSASRDRKI